MTFALRDYQHRIVDDARAALVEHGSVLIQSPTGSGKTNLATYMIGRAAERGKRAWFVCHRDFLLSQTAATFDQVGVRYGFIAANREFNPHRHVQIAAIDTLRRRLDRLKPPEIIVWDECIIGDSLIDTDVGTIRIDDVPRYGASLVRSWDGNEAAWKRIGAWRSSGRKNTLTIRSCSGHSITGTANHLVMTQNGWRAIGELRPGDEILFYPMRSEAAFSGRCSATHPYFFQTSGVDRQDSQQTTPLNNMLGRFIRRHFFRFFSRVFGSCQIPAMDQSWSKWLPHALHASVRFMKSHGPTAALSEFHRGGLMPLATPGWLGGTATMVTTSVPLTMPRSTRRDLDETGPCWRRSGSRDDLERQPCTFTNNGIASCDLIEIQPVDYSARSVNSYPNQCDTSWEKIVEISDSGEKYVYDISVPETECFFASGFLVHNCHHLAAASWRAVREWADAGGTRHVGLSATPARLDGRGLDDAFRAMVRGPSVAWLIERGFLSRYRAYAPTAPDLTGVHTRHGDYQRDELAGVMDTDTIAGNIVGTYKQLAGGKRAIYFGVSVAHSKHIAAAFNAAGVAARHLDASSSTVERVGAARDMARGLVRVLTNVDLFGEGFDLSAQAGEDVPVECVGLCRPTQSLALHLQQIGRALRPKPDPAIILDHAGNLMRHGLPDDDREWSLAGIKRAKRDQEYVPPVQQCPSCFGVFSAAARSCPYCGAVVAIPSPRVVTEIAVDLAEVDAERLRRARRAEQGRAETLEDLIRLGVQRGYRSPEKWARHVLDARSRTAP